MEKTSTKQVLAKDADAPAARKKQGQGGKKKRHYVPPTIEITYVRLEPLCASSVVITPGPTPQIEDWTDGGELNDTELNGL